MFCSIPIFHGWSQLLSSIGLARYRSATEGEHRYIGSSSIYVMQRPVVPIPVVDAAPHFEIIQTMMMNAQHRIMLIIDLTPESTWSRSRRKKKGDPPKRLGDFILWLCTPASKSSCSNGISARLLSRVDPLWSDVARYMQQANPVQALTACIPSVAPPKTSSSTIRWQCGGIDMTADRWDTPDHIDSIPAQTPQRQEATALA
jgi:hypothetical protein